MNLRVTAKSVFPLLLALGPLLASAQPARTIQISLDQQFGKAQFRECRLNVGTYEGAGRASVFRKDNRTFQLRLPVAKLAG